MTATFPRDEVVQLRGSLVELGPPENDRRSLKKQRSAVPPAEPWRNQQKFAEFSQETQGHTGSLDASHSHS